MSDQGSATCSTLIAIISFNLAHLCWFTQERWSRQGKRQLWMCLHRLWHFEQETEGLEGPWCVFFPPSCWRLWLWGREEAVRWEQLAPGRVLKSEVSGLNTLGGWLLTGWSEHPGSVGWGLDACHTHLEDFQGASETVEKNAQKKVENSIWSMVYVVTWKQMVNLQMKIRRKGLGTWL